MPVITFDQAKEFLEDINSEDKVAIICHNDGDGFSSGILYHDWCKSKNAQVKAFIYTIRESKLKEFDLEKFNKIIVTDLSPGFMATEFELIKEKQILYTDHHPRVTPIPEEILELVTADKGYLPSSRTAGELTGLKPWLSLIGTITDSAEYYPENQEFITKHLKQLGITFDEFKQNISSVVTNFLVYFDNDYDKAFEILKGINSIEEISQLKGYSDQVEDEVQKFVEEYKTKKEKLGHINFYYFEPHFKVKAPVCAIISQRNNNEIYIFAAPINDNKHITLSARSHSKEKDMTELLRAGTQGLEDSSSGGHAPAAGGTIQAKHLEKFKQNIRNFVKQ